MSQFSRDFVPGAHVHEWKFTQGSPYYFFGTKWGGCALGSGGSSNYLLGLYEESTEFRSFIQHQIQDGSITKTNLIALLTAKDNSSLKDSGKALLEEFFKKIPENKP